MALHIIATGKMHKGQSEIKIALPPVADPVPSTTLYLAGFQAAIRGADLAEMQTPEEVSGWWSAHELGNGGTP